LSRCVIITSYHSAGRLDYQNVCEDDFVICADGGYAHAISGGISPHIVIGDFDSYPENKLSEECGAHCKIIRLAVEKDDTDTMICLKYGIDQGFDQFLIIGGLGGRLDHTIANLQTLSYAIDCKKKLWILDGKNKATMIESGAIEIAKQENTKISLFSFTETCSGVSIHGVKYPLHETILNNSFPLGVSNEFEEEYARIENKKGKLLIILSQD
jgi:thiamine pyrophosphokinase